jgi:coniferyl-aldehyde dehydrogenase
VTDLGRLHAAQRAAFAAATPTLQDRRRALARLRDALLERETLLAAAIADDFGGRSPDETRLLEMLPLLDLIRHARRSLRSWMKPTRERSTWFLFPSRAYTVPQPLGVVGIIGAWNYPLLLTLGPLVDTIAAGNHAIVKPSEGAPATAAALATLIADTFPPAYIAVVTGSADVAEQLVSLPLDHVVFTGSTRVGALVMRAASANLTPVTLELGGKSPAIIHRSFPLEIALRRILTGKLYNAGQTCIAPDYVLVPAGWGARVEHEATSIARTLYPTLVANPDYTRIVNGARYTALQGLVNDAAARGARVVTLNPAAEACDAGNRVFPPTLVFAAPLDADIMREEIFGPILPIVEYESLDDAIAFVNDRPRPLALYYFDENRARIDRVIATTFSGGVTINDVVFHIAQHNLPFGGVGPSGMGHCHGRAGFERLSKPKAVMVQARRPLTSRFAPPFTNTKRGWLRFLLQRAAGRWSP